MNSIDGALAFLPAAVRLALWGALAGAATMLLYGRISPQKRLAALQSQVADARRALNQYQGDALSGAWPLMRRALGLSLLQVGLVLGPTLVAALPLVALIAWVDAAFAHRLPEPGETVRVTIHPVNHTVEWQPAEAVTQTADGSIRLRWPGPSDVRPTLQDLATGRVVLRVPIAAPRTSVSRPSPWNWLFASPAGYLPAGSPVARVQFDLPRRAVWAAGPAWLRTWHAPFLSGLLCAALAVKVAFRII